MAISALTGEGIPDLLEKTHVFLYEDYIPVHLYLSYKKGGLIKLFHNQGQVDRIEQGTAGVEIHGQIPGRLLSYFQQYQKDN